jgi:hypothetical protein
MADKIEIPRRRVKKNWYVGLHSDPVDRSHPDVHDEQLVVEAAQKMSRKLFLHPFQFFIRSNFTQFSLWSLLFIKYFRALLEESFIVSLKIA